MRKKRKLTGRESSHIERAFGELEIFYVIANGVKQSPPLPGDCFGKKRLAMTQNRDLTEIGACFALGGARNDTFGIVFPYPELMFL